MVNIFRKVIMETKFDVDKLKEEYDQIINVHQKFCKELERILSELILQDNIELGFPVSSRVKTWDSIQNKLQRVSLKINKATDYQDLVGIRLILLFPRDIAKIEQLINKTFKVEREYDTGEKLKPDQFGYKSIHIIIQIPESWFGMPTMAQFRGCRAEIQIRTLAQHLWAEASKVLQYKNENNVPVPLKRSISRVSALLELIDLELERVLEGKEDYRDTLLIKVPEQNLDADLLEVLLNKLLPTKNKDKQEYYSELLLELFYFEIDTPDKLTKFLKNHEKDILQMDQEIVSQKRTSHLVFSQEEKERIDSGVFLTHTGLVRQALDNQYGREWRSKLFTE